jgi:hypothetical protein
MTLNLSNRPGSIEIEFSSMQTASSLESMLRATRT